MKLKKVLLVGGIATLGLVLLGGFPLVKSAVGWVGDKMDEHHAKMEKEREKEKEKNFDADKEIKALKDEVANLVKEESNIKDDLSKEIAAAEKLTVQTASLRAAIEDERKKLVAFGETIKDAEAKSVKVSLPNKVQLDVGEAKKKLQADTGTWQKRTKMLADLETSLKMREEAKAILYSELSETEDIRRTLLADLDALEVEYKALKLQAKKNKYTRDEGKVSEVRERIEKLKERAAEKRARVGLDTGKGRPDAPVSESVDDILAPVSGK